MKMTFILSIAILVLSCNLRENTIEKKIVGNWVITEFKINNKECKDDLLINGMSFHSDYKFLIPEIYHYPAEDEEDSTNWTISVDSTNRKDVFLRLDCKNPIFRGRYVANFIKDSDKRLLGITLKSETTYILAYKTLQDYDVDGKDW